MQNLVIAFNVVFPLFILIALGYFARIRGFIDDRTVKQVNKMIYNLILSVLIFTNVYHTDIKTTFNPKFMLFGIGGAVALFGLAFGFVCAVEKRNEERGTLIQGIFRSNFIIFGMAVTDSLFGSESNALVSVLGAFVVPICNSLAIITLEIFKNKKINGKKLLKGIVTNPIIAGCLLAFIFVFCKIRIPLLIDEILVDISALATPISLIFLGASFTFTSMKGKMKLILMGVIGKLIAAPAIFITLAVLFGFRGAELAALLAYFAAPCAVSSFNMVEQVGGDSELAAQLVVLTSVFSIITIFGWIVLLKSLGFM